MEGIEAAQENDTGQDPKGHSLVKAALAYLYRGEHGHAEAYLERESTILEEYVWMQWRWHFVLPRVLGELALAQGRYDDAWTYAAQSLDLATQSDSRKHMARAQRLQGEILAATVRLEVAVQTLTASMRLAKQIGTPREIWLGKAALGKVLMQLNRDKEAEAQFTQATQIIETIAADLRTPRLLDSLLNAAPVVELYDTLGRRLLRPPTAS